MPVNVITLRVGDEWRFRLILLTNILNPITFLGLLSVSGLRFTVRTLEPWTLDICFYIFLVTIECGLDLLIRVFNVFTLTKCETCNTIHHKKNHYFLIVKKMYRKMSSVHGSSVLTVKTIVKLPKMPHVMFGFFKFPLGSWFPASPKLRSSRLPKVRSCALKES